MKHGCRKGCPYAADLKWNHMAIAEEGGLMPKPPTGAQNRTHNKTKEDHLKTFEKLTALIA